MTLIVVPADSCHLELLRTWKNANSERFFNSDPISREAQESWFEGYKKRPQENIWVLTDNGVEIGCIGTRETDAGVELFNVILGEIALRGRGHMREALRLILESKIQVKNSVVWARVLDDNPAIGWYEAVGLRRLVHIDNFWLVAGPMFGGKVMR